MDRRTALHLVAIGALAPAGVDAQHVHAAGSAPAQSYQLRFFTPEENLFLDQIMELIIPADAHSPGAHAAKVSYFADWMISHSPEKLQREWRAGLRQLREEAANSSPAEALAAAAKGQTPFFTRLKDMTVDGYYTSQIGIHQDLNYQGNEYVVEFPGCTHPEHQ
ncbi:MAG TPA: gluconate 2-dehydrogenase subunit 3 family protein [Bryobacteraceae bacterium]|nr:gluconate 2-dehydrogenase subunit 3 family protein [Bryobacteraceae bacterium]